MRRRGATADDCQIPLGSQVTPDAMVPVAGMRSTWWPTATTAPDSASAAYEDALRGPQPGSEVDDAIGQHGTATGGAKPTARAR